MTSDAVRPHPAGASVEIRVRPRAKRFRIERRADRVIVAVPGEPSAGEANANLVRALGECFERRVEIVRGHKSKMKTVVVHGATPAEVEARLAAESHD